MKKIFIAMMAMAAMAACATEDTIVTPQGAAIAFGNPFVENSVRATDNTYGGGENKIEEVYVWGTVKGKHAAENEAAVYIFDGAEVNDDNNPGEEKAWNCSVVQYWVPNAKYAFTAVVDGELSGENKDQIAYTVADQADVLLATAVATTDNNAAVESGSTVTAAGIVKFNFAHLLSKAVFEFYTTKAFKTDDYTYLIEDIQFDNAYTSGTYSVTNSAWTATETSSLPFGADVTVEPSTTEAVTATSEFVRVFIPAASMNVSFKMSILFNGTSISEKTYNLTATPDQGFKAGYSYKIKAEITENKPIQFTLDASTELGWANGGEITVQ